MTAPALSICVIPGDGIGKEVTDCAREVMLAATAAVGGPSLTFSEHAAGYGAFEKMGDALPESTLSAALQADGVLMGALAVSDLPASARNPLRGLRVGLGISASLRPSRPFTGVPSHATDLDVLFVREVTEGFYSGIEYSVGADAACAIRLITREASLRAARLAFDQAERRRGDVTVVHKVSALRLTDSLFIECAEQVAVEHPGVNLRKRNVDACAMDLVASSRDLDVILTTNCFGDILSDVASALTGGVGIAPSACIGTLGSYFEPVHGTAPRKAGLGVANPIATIRSSAMMLEHIGHPEIATVIEAAVEHVLNTPGPRTRDLGGTATSSEMMAAVIKHIDGRSGAEGGRR